MRRAEAGRAGAGRLSFFGGALTALVLLFSAACRPDSDGGRTIAEPAAQEEDPAAVAKLLPGPDFELLGLDGKRHRLTSYRGKLLVVNYWATWCTSCRQEIPELDALYRELAPAGVEIVGISVDAEGAEKVRPYVEEIGIHYPILLDPEAVSGALFGGLEGYPKSFILDREGLIYSSYLGAQTAETFRQDLEYLLDAPASPAATLPSSDPTRP